MTTTTAHRLGLAAAAAITAAAILGALTLGPAAEVPTTTTTTEAPAAAAITEDDPRWNCEAMGDRVCGPADTAPGADVWRACFIHWHASPRGVTATEAAAECDEMAPGARAEAPSATP